MKGKFIGFGIILLLASCGGHNSNQYDSTEYIEEGDSILIDESTRLHADSASLHLKDSVEIKDIPFSSVSELKDFLRKSPHSKEYSQGILPLVADYSLEYAGKLVNNRFDGFIVVDKSRMKVILFDKYGREKLSYGMACAKNYGTKHKKADARTPEGFFTAAGIYDSTEWLFTDDDGKTSPKKGQFGPRFIRLKCPNTSQIGIHGTVAPWSIGHRSSHGCIRVTNENILELVKHVKVGMPIIVIPGRKDMAVNEYEGYESVWIPTVSNYKEPKPKESEIAELEAKDKAEELKESEAITQNTEKNDSINKDHINIEPADSIKVENPSEEVEGNEISNKSHNGML